MQEDKKNMLLLQQEIKLAKILASNNKTLRDRTLKRLKKFLEQRAQATSVNDDVFMRIWKGLFYYMWMSDKLLVQEECAEKIGHLVHFRDPEISLRFFKCFLKTMVQEWFGIDFHRLDKFLMLVRRVLRQAFYVLKNNGWETENVDLFKEILNETVLKMGNTSSLGLTLHFIEIYLEELAKVCEGDINNENILLLIQPFAQHLARTEDRRVMIYIKKNIFRYLMMQSDLGLEYQEQFEAWRKAGFPGGHIDCMKKIEIDADDDDDENQHLEQSEKHLDPRAGRVNVDLPQLPFDPLAFSNLFQELLYKKYTSQSARRILKQLSREFKQMSTGKFPLAIKKMPTVSKQDLKLNVKSALKRLEKFEKSLDDDTDTAKTQKSKTEKILNAAQSELTKPIKSKKSVNDFEKFVKKSEGGLLDDNLPRKKIKLVKENGLLTKNVTKKKSKVMTNGNNVNLTAKQTKRKLVEGETNNKKGTKRKKIEEAKENHEILQNFGTWHVDDLLQKHFEKIAKKTKQQENNKKTQQTTNKTIKNVDAWKEPLKDGETEFFVMSNKTKQKLKKMKKPVTTKPDVVLNPFSPGTPKKIKFALNLNKSQEIHEHHAKVSESPNIPFDAAKKPSKPLLKPTNLSSPLNPFYKNNSF